MDDRSNHPERSYGMNAPRQVMAQEEQIRRNPADTVLGGAGCNPCREMTIVESCDRQISDLADRAEGLRIARDRIRKAGWGDMPVSDFHRMFQGIF